MEGLLGRAGGQAYRVRSNDLWGLAREAYLEGMTGPEVCERFGLGLGALRERARKEGWRRADQPDPEPVVDEGGLDQLDADPFLTAADLAALAWQRAKAAVLRGTLREALGWRRVHRDYLEMAERDEREGDDLDSVEAYTRWSRPSLWRYDGELYRNPHVDPPEEAEAETAGAASAPSDAVAEPGAPDAFDSLDSFDSISAAREPLPPPDRAARRNQARVKARTDRQSARGP